MDTKEKLVESVAENFMSHPEIVHMKIAFMHQLVKLEINQIEQISKCSFPLTCDKRNEMLKIIPEEILIRIEKKLSCTMLLKNLMMMVFMRLWSTQQEC